MCSELPTSLPIQKNQRRHNRRDVTVLLQLTCIILQCPDFWTDINKDLFVFLSSLKRHTSKLVRSDQIKYEKSLLIWLSNLNGMLHTIPLHSLIFVPFLINANLYFNHNYLHILKNPMKQVLDTASVLVVILDFKNEDVVCTSLQLNHIVKRTAKMLTKKNQRSDLL